MQSDKQGNPAASAFPFENSEFGLSACDDYNGVVDFTSFCEFPNPVDPLPWEDANLSYLSNKQQISNVTACTFLNPEASSAQAGYQMNRLYGDANTPIIARPQSTNHSASLQSRFLSHISHRNPQIKAATDAKSNIDETGSLKKIHGRFLSLGPESNIDDRSSTNIGNPAASASTGLISRPFHILQTSPEVDMQQIMLSMPNNRISNSESNRDPKYDTIQGDQLASSSAYSSSSTAFPLSGKNRVINLASESHNRTGTAIGIDPHQLHNIASSQNHSLSSIVYPRLLRTEQRGGQHGYSGVSVAHEGSLDDAAVINVIPDINKFQIDRPDVDTRVVFPKRHGIQGTFPQAPQGSSIPIDRGFQAASKYCNSLNGTPVWRDLHVSSAYGQSPSKPVLPSASYGGSLTENGPPQSSLPIQNWRPMSTTGQDLRVAKINEDPQNCGILNRPSLKRAAVQSPLDATWVHNKKLTHNPAIPPSMSYQPIPPSTSGKPIPPSMPYKAVPLSMSGKPVPPPVSFRPQKAPALLPTETTAHPSMSALTHIKWQGIDEQPELTGDKCLICKRDLIFSPEGPVERPPISPPVAVLNCGHTFHDNCLQKITPEDQSKSPPCIPCAIGEN